MYIDINNTIFYPSMAYALGRINFEKKSYFKNQETPV